MEALWKDLSGDEEKYDSPAWHEAALGETEKRMNDGIEKVVDWDFRKRISGRNLNEDSNPHFRSKRFRRRSNILRKTGRGFRGLFL